MHEEVNSIDVSNSLSEEFYPNFNKDHEHYNQDFQVSDTRNLKYSYEWEDDNFDYNNLENNYYFPLEEDFEKLNLNSHNQDDEEFQLALAISQADFESSKNALANLSEEEIKKPSEASLPLKPQENPSFNQRRSLVSVYRPANTISMNPEDTYTILKKIGAGGSGQIYLSKKKSTNEDFAIKIINTKSSSLPKGLILNEVNLTLNSRHSNIIKYLEVYDYNDSIWIVEELMSFSLYDIIFKRPGQIPENISGYILREILKGLNYLHKRHRIHRDIKSDNILLSDKGEIKIADFGLCAQVNENQPNRQTFAGTLLWMAPEILKQDKYDYKIDIWSLGIVAFELGTGEPPYYKQGQNKIVSNILGQKPVRLIDFVKSSNEFNSFIDRCLEKDPKSRPDTDELLNHPFILNSDCTFQEFYNFIEEFKG